MTVHTQQVSEQILMREMGLTEQTIDRRKKLVGLTSEDLTHVAAIKGVVLKHIQEYPQTFITFLSKVDEAKPIIANRALCEQALSLESEHLLAMVQGDYGTDYVEQRLKLALLYSSVRLDPLVFFGAFHALLKHVGTTVMQQFEHAPLEGFENFMALKKIAFFDIGITVDVLVFERERTIRQQQEAIRELSTPVLQIRERLLLLPIIGVIDSHRARLITESLLRSIRANRAKVVVMDVTGVGTIDSKVANHLLQTVTAARLMGASVIVTGLSSEVAQSLATLGIELSKLNTVGDLQGGIEEAERFLGYRVTQTAESGSQLA
jgi:rsbT co-antagonist protein RsbR